MKVNPRKKKSNEVAEERIGPLIISKQELLNNKKKEKKMEGRDENIRAK